MEYLKCDFRKSKALNEKEKLSHYIHIQCSILKCNLKFVLLDFDYYFIVPCINECKELKINIFIHLRDWFSSIFKDSKVQSKICVH